MSLGHYFTDAGQTPTYTDLFGLFSSLPTDLSGKMVIKATLGEEIRRIPLINDDLTYDELILMMQRIFRGKITPADEILIKYKDEDGDLVTISDNVDLAHAKLNMKVLRIHLFLNVSSGGHSHSTPVPNVEEVKKELTAMRDRLNELIGKLEIAQQQAVKDKEAAKPAAAEVDQKPAAVRLNSSDIENFLGGSGEKKDAIHPSVGSMFQQKQGQSQPIAQPRQAQPTSSTQYGPPPPFTNAPGPAPQQQSHTGYQQQPQPIPQQQQQQPVLPQQQQQQMQQPQQQPQVMPQVQPQMPHQVVAPQQPQQQQGPPAQQPQYPPQGYYAQPAQQAGAGQPAPYPGQFATPSGPQGYMPQGPAPQQQPPQSGAVQPTGYAPSHPSYGYPSGQPQQQAYAPPNYYQAK
eukprot:Colp12_sorted_trinity150504_noHs@23925